MYNFVTQDKRLIPIYHRIVAPNANFQGFNLKYFSGIQTATEGQAILDYYFYLPDNTKFATVASAQAYARNDYDFHSCFVYGFKFTPKDANNPRAYMYIAVCIDYRGSTFDERDIQLGADILYYCENERLMAFKEDKTLLPFLYSDSDGKGAWKKDDYATAQETLEMISGSGYLWSTILPSLVVSAKDGLSEIKLNKLKFIGNGYTRYGGDIYVANSDEKYLLVISDDKKLDRLIGNSPTGRFLSEIVGYTPTINIRIAPGEKMIIPISLGTRHAHFAVLSSFYPAVNGAVIGDRYMNDFDDTVFQVEIFNRGDTLIQGSTIFFYNLYCYEKQS